MPEVALVTDSSACLPQELIREYGITVVPLAMLVDGQLYHDGALSSDEFYARLNAARKPPTTTSSAPGEFLQAFRCAYAGGVRQILCLTLSARYSGTHSSALNAGEMASTEMPDLHVDVLDTGGIAMTHGFAVLAAARALRGGASLDQAVEASQTVGSRAHLVGVLDTTRYLAKSGRVPWIAHWAASVLRVKPVLAARARKIGAVGRVRTPAQGNKRLLDYIAAKANGETLHVAVMHAGAPDRARQLAAMICDRFHPNELLVTEFTAVMGVHTGPGFVGVAFYSGA